MLADSLVELLYLQSADVDIFIDAILPTISFIVVQHLRHFQQSFQSNLKRV